MCCGKVHKHRQCRHCCCKLTDLLLKGHMLLRATQGKSVSSYGTQLSNLHATSLHCQPSPSERPCPSRHIIISSCDMLNCSVYATAGRSRLPHGTQTWLPPAASAECQHLTLLSVSISGCLATSPYPLTTMPQTTASQPIDCVKQPDSLRLDRCSAARSCAVHLARPDAAREVAQAQQRHTRAVAVEALLPGAKRGGAQHHCHTDRHLRQHPATATAAAQGEQRHIHCHLRKLW